MARDEVLDEVGAVGVAVEIDRSSRSAGSGREVVGGVGGGEQADAPRPNALDLPPAVPGAPREGAPRGAPVNDCTLLQSISPEPPVPRLSTSSSPRSRKSGPKIPRYSTAAGRGISRPALDGDDGGPVPVGAR